MEGEKMVLFIPSKIYFCTLPLSVDGMPSDMSQLEVSLKWRNISNSLFYSSWGLGTRFCNVRV